jgi:hypothetical protein
VDRYSEAIRGFTKQKISYGTKKGYKPAPETFATFAIVHGIPEDIFERSVEEINEVLLFYAMYLRETGKGHLRDAWGNKMSMIEQTITGKISAIIYYIGQHDNSLGAALHRKKDEPTPLSGVLSGMNRTDKLLRGDTDRYKKIPAGIEFAQETRKTITLTITDPRLAEMYYVLVILEYMIGPRTMEFCVAPKVKRLTQKITETSQSTPTIDELDKSNSIHSLTAQNLQLHWINNGRTLTLSANQAQQFPSNPPTSLTFYGTSKNNPFGKGPTTITINPHLPGSSNICAVTETYRWLRRRGPLAANEFVFLGAHDSLFTKEIKTTATRVGLDPDKMFITSFRIGCESATTAGILDLSQEALRQLAQQFQHWHTPGGAKTYHISQFDEGLIKTIQLYHLATTSIDETIARFMRFH